jgi:NTP pyrophosphatase (non-canonical NTP hydrolase)
MTTVITSLDEYQEQAMRTRNRDLDYRDELILGQSGLASESGEVAEAVKHYLFHGHPLDRDNLKKELGDIMWYVSQLAKAHGWYLSDVATTNINKLRARYPAGFSEEASLNRDTSKE